MLFMTCPTIANLNFNEILCNGFSIDYLNSDILIISKLEGIFGII
jgi:hypothetical protein